MTSIPGTTARKRTAATTPAALRETAPLSPSHLSYQSFLSSTQTMARSQEQVHQQVDRGQQKSQQFQHFQDFQDFQERQQKPSPS